MQKMALLFMAFTFRLTGDRPGDKGLAAIPGREEEFKASLATGIAYAKTLDCKMWVLH